LSGLVPMLPRLPALLTSLSARLLVFLPIVCHKNSPP
jgi:hypothetical protein